MLTCRLVSFCLVFASLFVFAGCSDLEQSKTFEIIDVKCGKCHHAYVVYMKKRTKIEWDIAINGMKVRGLKVSPEEERQIKDILYNNFTK
jgi:uncharacterized lipoprotein YehR (DUF1307 family)